jgi:hypothetical protein
MTPRRQFRLRLQQTQKQTQKLRSSAGGVGLGRRAGWVVAAGAAGVGGEGLAPPCLVALHAEAHVDGLCPSYLIGPTPPSLVLG